MSHLTRLLSTLLVLGLSQAAQATPTYQGNITDRLRPQIDTTDVAAQTCDILHPEEPRAILVASRSNQVFLHFGDSTHGETLVGMYFNPDEDATHAELHDILITGRPVMETAQARGFIGIARTSLQRCRNTLRATGGLN